MTFLEYVAQDIKNKYGTNLGRIAVVFPNKRASIFLNAALAQGEVRPIWSPAYITISQLFRSQSKLQVADPIKLVCDLYQVYIQLTHAQETFEHFYGWGQLLLSDFDDLDKNMADPKQVFRNVEGLHEYDDVTFLNDDQKQLVQKFFANFTDNQDSYLKQKFLEFWSRLYDIYTEYNNHLASQNLAYEGQLYRQVAKLDELKLNYDCYLFVGFNMMQEAEIRLARKMQELGKAKFYWDFDTYYTRPIQVGDKEIPHEAGFYVNQLRKLFPNQLDESREDIFDNLSQLKDITIVAAPTEDIQARYVATWLKEHDRYKDGTRTAVVLADENLLPTMVHCIPEEVKQLNITMGYPLALSPLTSLVMQLIQLQVNKRYRNTYSRKIFIDKLLRLPYASLFDSDLLSEPLSKGSSSDPDPMKLMDFLFEVIRQMGVNCRKLSDSEEPFAANPFFQESLFRIYTQLNRLRQLIEQGDLPEMSGEGLQALLRQLINSDSVPFHGEPAVGVQVMGVLETRNLDFDHVLVLSCNEGNLPKGVNDTSFIPYAIRKAFQLTTVDNKVGIYSYYFHSLIQRAKDVTLVYNQSASDGKTGEMSRFMLQLITEKGMAVRRLELQTPLEILKQQPPTIEKKGRVKEALESINSFAPTAINNYLRCPLRFYYRYIAHVKEPEETAEDGIDNIQFGLIFHKAAQLIYDSLKDKNQMITESAISDMLKDKKRLNDYLDDAFKEEYFHDTKPSYNGLQVINRQVLLDLLCKMLEIDKKRTPFQLLGTECKVLTSLPKAHNGKIDIYGYIDRLDGVFSKGDGMLDQIRIVDYKTGRKKNGQIKLMEDIFKSENILNKHTDYYLQTILYASIVWKDNTLNPNGLGVSPQLFYVQNAKDEETDFSLLINKEPVVISKDFLSEFRSHLVKVLDEIFDETIPFQPTTVTKQCDTCPFKPMCY
ncbi:MAG: PD-(D/E)XK nuclease family protein [Prevotella sp.]|jgi:CRISPR/Cas system-associated exonuclease Cas4 (RecB family)